LLHYIENKYENIKIYIKYLPLLLIICILLGYILITSLSKIIFNKITKEYNNQADIYASKLADSLVANKKLDILLDEKLMNACKLVVSSKENLSNGTLEGIAKNLNMDKIYWFNSQGEVIYTANDYMGWKASEGLEISIPFTKEIREEDYVELKYKMEMPKGNGKSAIEYINLNDKKPALYKDVSNDDKEAKIKKLVDEKILSAGGVGNGYFGINAPTRRGDFVTVLGKLVETKGLEQIVNKDTLYKDVKNEDYYNRYIVWASEKRFINGYNNKFMPKQMIKVQDASIILTRFLKEYNIEIEDLLEAEMVNPKASLTRSSLVEILHSTINSLENPIINQKDKDNDLAESEINIDKEL